ncbi:hypothetical protein [Alkalihalobacterium bogoriense]|uniref:hypothetical protein n=1 Tax=Alkalihalobacterium bogoriense TaxID=246272 RepID=UPI000479E05B|nr:hypothetical protein [Alkalihalobacterium bogoriense]
MEVVLTQEEVNNYMSLLNQSQREFIEENIKQKKKSKWLEVLAKSKGIMINATMSLEEIESKIADWILIDVKDGGYMKRPFKCDCGARLRYQYILKNSKTKETRKLGVNCLEKHISLSPQIIKDVKKGIYHIDLERDEILTKFYHRDFYTRKIPKGFEVPDLFAKQLALELPLTDLQIHKLDRLLDEYESKRRYEKRMEMERLKRKKAIESLNEEQSAYFQQLNESDKTELVQLLIKEGQTEQEELDEIDVIKDDEILKHIELELPLLQRQKQVIDSAKRSQLIKYATEELTLESILERHLETLQAVRHKQEQIPRGLRKDWVTIQELVRSLKNGEDFNYARFKLLLSNLIIPLRIKKDKFL